MTDTEIHQVQLYREAVLKITDCIQNEKHIMASFYLGKLNACLFYREAELNGQKPKWEEK